jgi:hypothetical protein
LHLAFKPTKPCSTVGHGAQGLPMLHLS